MNIKYNKKDFEIIEFGKEQAYKNLFEKIKINKPRYITLDIFDTLLIRKNKLELNRFKESSKIISNIFKLSPENVFNARVFSHKTCYNIKINGEREAKFFDIVSLMCRELNLSKDSVEKIIKIELDFEKNDLLVNKELIKVLNKSGKVVYLLSDMYLSENNILELIKSLKVDLKFKNIYVSSDRNLSKRTGSFFEYLISEFNHPGFHIGDNYLSDIKMANKFKFKTFHLRQYYG